MDVDLNEAVAKAPNLGNNKNKGDGWKEAVADDKSPAESAPDKMNNGTKSSREDATFDGGSNEAVAETEQTHKGGNKIMGDDLNEAVAEASNEGDNKNKGDSWKEAVTDDKSPAESAPDEMNNGTKSSSKDATFDGGPNEAVAET